MTLWMIGLTGTHPMLSKNVYVYCIIPSSLFKTGKSSASTGAESLILWHRM